MESAEDSAERLKYNVRKQVQEALDISAALQSLQRSLASEVARRERAESERLAVLELIELVKDNATHLGEMIKQEKEKRRQIPDYTTDSDEDDDDDEVLNDDDDDLVGSLSDPSDHQLSSASSSSTSTSGGGSGQAASTTVVSSSSSSAGASTPSSSLGPPSRRVGLRPSSASTSRPPNRQGAPDLEMQLIMAEIQGATLNEIQDRMMQSMTFSAPPTRGLKASAIATVRGAVALPGGGFPVFKPESDMQKTMRGDDERYDRQFKVHITLLRDWIAREHARIDAQVCDSCEQQCCCLGWCWCCCLGWCCLN
jgi:hypothetical protein